jgi:hypothetical protein
MNGGGMQVFGGFMMMLSTIGFFLAVIWFILPFVIFTIKGRVDQTLLLVEQIERRLDTIEVALKGREPHVRGEPAEPLDLLLEPTLPQSSCQSTDHETGGTTSNNHTVI